MEYTPEDIKRIRKSLKLNQEELAEKIGLTREMVSKMETAVKPISELTTIKLKELELSSHSASGKSVTVIGKHVPTRLKSGEMNEAFKDWLGLPMYNIPVTASFIESYRDEGNYEPQYYLPDPRFRDCDFGAIITGDSMHSEIRHGDFIACREITNRRFLVYGEIYYVIASNGLETCKYVNEDPDNPDNLLLVPRNEKMSSSKLPKDMVSRIFKVRGVVRGY